MVAGGRQRERRNPSRLSDIVSHTPSGGAAEIDAAVAAAEHSFAAWSSATPEVRADVLEGAAARLWEQRQAYGALLAREEGKTVPEGVGEVGRAARILRYFAGEAVRAGGLALASVRPGVDVTTWREPLGVVGLITPWNFPIAIPAWKAAPALAFGNTVVLKPSELTPVMADVLAQALADAGAPASAFNVVYGDREAGEALTAHPRVAAISFTGSQRAGHAVRAVATQRGARVQLEMGGKNPLVVMNDADLGRAVQCALDGTFFSTGQRCTASSRLIVEAGLYDAFVSRLWEAMQTLRIGPADEAGVQIGPVVSAEQKMKIAGHVADATGMDMRSVRLPNGLDGHFVSPTLVLDAARDAPLNHTEIFGPVASVLRVADFDEALSAANDGEFGLSAGIVTSSLKSASEFRRRVRAGMAMVNLPTAGVDYHVPFGGVAGSSYGPHEQGPAAVEFFTQTKTVYAHGG